MIEKVQKSCLYIILGKKATPNYTLNLKLLKLDRLDERRDILKTLRHSPGQSVARSVGVVLLLWWLLLRALFVNIVNSMLTNRACYCANSSLHVIKATLQNVSVYEIIIRNTTNKVKQLEEAEAVEKSIVGAKESAAAPKEIKHNEWCESQL